MSPDAVRPKRWIKPLPKQVINKIAAGEVVERPASVVKELVENSIDAGSARVDVIVEKSGTRLIQVVDDGCGIEADQMEVAFSRHATSKIAGFDDLDRLDSYGFRGEALPSVASVSRLRMVSRSVDADVGMEIVYEGGVLDSLKPIAAPPGTSIEVRDLFFNTPARRKFLKTEATEYRYIARVATALALGRHAVGFSLHMNGRALFSLLVGQNLKERVAGLLAPGKAFVPVEGQGDLGCVRGFLGPPDLAQNNRNGLYIFINSRYVQSPVIAHAVVAAYGELMPKGTFPIGALLLEVDPNQVDVNVHPAKTEVRLSHERELHDVVYRTVKEGLRQDGVIPAYGSLRPARPPNTSVDQATHSEADSRRHSDAVIPGIERTPHHDASILSELHTSDVPPAGAPSGTVVRVDTSTGEVLPPEEATAPEPTSGPSGGFRLIGRFGDVYLLLQSGDDLFIVDQHTAHERVLYEENLRRVQAGSVDAQVLLFPVQVELSAEQFAVFEESLEQLNQCGFALSPFGGRTVRMEAVPSVLSKRAPESILLSVLDDIASMRKQGFEFTKALAQSMACRAAVMAGDCLSDSEATHLLQQLLRCENSYSCPHGRPTFVRLSRADVDRQFGRG